MLIKLHRAECQDPKTILLKRIVHSAYSIEVRKKDSMDELLTVIFPFLGAQEALPQVPEIGLEEVNHLPTMVSVDNTVVIPANTHLRDIVTSGDVAHSWASSGVGFTVDEHHLSLTGQSSFLGEVSQDSIWFAMDDNQSKLERENCEFIKNKFLQLATIREELDQIEHSFPSITKKLAPSKAIDLIMKNIVSEKTKPGIKEVAAHSDIRRYKMCHGRIWHGTDPDYPPIVPQPPVNDIDMKGKCMEFYRKYSSNGGE